MKLYSEFAVFRDKFFIHFTENKGMAFGWELGGDTGKLMLTLFRIFAVFVIIYFIGQLRRSKAHRGLMFAMALILAGAIGNIIDSVFYGVLFTDSYGKVATFLPEGGGYAKIFHGHVVDMLYFPLYDGYLPDWVPFWGGKHTIFFRPIFNIADSAISVGVFIIILFNRVFFKEDPNKDQGLSEQELKERSDNWNELKNELYETETVEYIKNSEEIVKEAEKVRANENPVIRKNPKLKTLDLDINKE